jgi:hypothetical protein
MQIKLIIITMVSITALIGCASYKTTLINANGETVVCEASGKSGPVTGYYLRRGFEDCISAAKARGFKEAPQTNLKTE